ncbi:hypothetical protein [Rhizobium sp. CCGE 510]|uniref:hypothetical protein n=1 Tax=Rhizobium sp. CCGE 510 TaxID=1132836 RepID=UPI00027B8138|nr:hypothetical protein [Rhizobium sp. CCGE 510]EJT04982.1 hypothetical protein RCCGE510_12641 [Rhizobium sp. CCGE 510]
MDNLMLYARLAGFRLAVIAGRTCCEDDFSGKLHDRLIDGLDAAIDRIRAIMALERRFLDCGDEVTAYQLAGEVEIFGRTTIDLLDRLDIDHETHEYRINGGCWSNALAADNTGVYVEYPTLVSLSNEALGSLAPIVLAITTQTGLAIRAAHIDDGRPEVLQPSHAVRLECA